jgi:hypothetical protein
MENVSLRLEGTKLIAEIELDTRGRPSKTGMNLTLATTGGNKRLSELIEYDGDAVVGINVYRKGQRA